LPVGWTEASIGELIGSGKLWVKNGYADGRFNSEGIGIPHLRTFNISDAGEIDLSQIKSVSPPPPDDPHRLRHGDVIFNNTNSEELVGKAALFDLAGEFVLSNHMTILRVLDREHIEPAFLARSLHRKWITGEARMLCRRHVNQASINLDRLKGVRLLFPPLPEQRAIAGVLRTVQRAREACERVLAATRQLKQSLLHHLFTYGPVPFPHAPHVPLKETEIGPMPEHWSVGRLGELASVVMGSSPSGETYNSDGRGVPLINGPAEYGPKHPIPVKWTSAPTRVCNPGDIIFCVRGNTVGRMNEADRELCIGRGVAAISQLSGKSDTGFLRFLMEREAPRILQRATAGGSTFPNINKPELLAWQIPAPPLSEQREIARQLGAVDAKIAALEKRRAALDALFRSLLEHLMTGRLRLPEFANAKPPGRQAAGKAGA
jgi:type I restriction enzyme S subunit